MTYNGFPNRETWAASLTISDQGWDDIAEDAISAWCALHWSSSVPNDEAGRVIKEALLAEDEFLADLSKTASDVDPANIVWDHIGENVVFTMADRQWN